MQAIQIKFLPATNTKGSRLKAFCAAGSITVGFHSTEASQPDLQALEVAEMLRAKLGWTEEYYGKLHIGGLPNGDYVAVFEDKDRTVK